MGEFISCKDCLCDMCPERLPFGGCSEGYRDCCSSDGKEGCTVKSIDKWCPIFDKVRGFILKNGNGKSC